MVNYNFSLNINIDNYDILLERIRQIYTLCYYIFDTVNNFAQNALELNNSFEYLFNPDELRTRFIEIENLHEQLIEDRLENNEQIIDKLVDYVIKFQNLLFDQEIGFITYVNELMSKYYTIYNLNSIYINDYIQQVIYLNSKIYYGFY